MYRTNGIFRFLEAKRSIMSLTLLYVSVSVHHGWDSHTLFSHRVSNSCLRPPKCGERSFTRCNGYCICHKDLEKPTCMGIKLSSVDQCRPWSWSRQWRDITSKYLVLISSINRELVAIATSSSSGHVQNDTIELSRSLLQVIFLFTDFNNLKQKVCFNFLQFLSRHTA